MRWINARKVTWSTILRSVSIIYFLWWAITAASIVWVIILLLKTALFRWVDMGGWRFYYGLGGACFLVYVLFIIGPSLLSASIEFAREQGLIAIVVGTVIFGACTILAIPLIFAGWPLWLWLIWDSRKK